MSSRVIGKDLATALPLLEWPDWTAVAGSPLSGRASLALGQARAPSPPGAEPGLGEKEAYQKGLREGEAAGTRKSFEQWQSAIQGLAQTTAMLAGYKATLRAEVERDLVTLSLAVARRILRRELVLDNNLVLAVVRSCLHELQNAEIYHLRLNPQDVEPVAACFQQHRPPLQLLADPEVSRGGAVFETSQGQLDARLETQLAEIERGLTDR